MFILTATSDNTHTQTHTDSECLMISNATVDISLPFRSPPTPPRTPRPRR